MQTQSSTVVASHLYCRKIEIKSWPISIPPKLSHATTAGPKCLRPTNHCRTTQRSDTYWSWGSPSTTATRKAITRATKAAIAPPEKMDPSGPLAIVLVCDYKELSSERIRACDRAMNSFAIQIRVGTHYATASQVHTKRNLSPCTSPGLVQHYWFWTNPKWSNSVQYYSKNNSKAF